MALQVIQENIGSEMFRSLIKVWICGYRHPRKFSMSLSGQPAPWLGFLAQAWRALFNAILLYFPLVLLGREPSTPSYLVFITTEGYYRALIWIAPVFLILQWLLATAIIYMVLRGGSQSLDFDVLLNITGASALVVGSALILWDWLWVIFGWQNPVLLGCSHLVFDVWGGVLVVYSMREHLNVPVRLALAAYLVAIILSLPLAALIMRAPI